ncbi:PPOX class F420-dependent oxidoreductase [Nocardia transvalensis]|uniref:PPOX class F420-dependent oxidoreductase n=1 Tax=Nocardia transvalensis TaxID=37333 RepID=UPI001E2C314D|nr:PPOX class F420-dependent oxidoreductase [Nocardia transvalensis]
MKAMTEQQWRAFVSEGTRTGKLATVRPDGRPHVAPLWFLLDGDDLVFTTGITSVKGRNLTHSGRAAMLVHDDRDPFEFVMIEGPVSISEDRDETVRWAIALAERYVGPERAEQVGTNNATTNNEFRVRLAIETVTAVAGADEI